MRVSPLVIPCLYYNDQEIKRLVELIHYPTHLHKEAISTSVIYIKLLIFLFGLAIDDISTIVLLDYIENVMIKDSEFLPDLSYKLKYIVNNINENEYDVMDELIGLDGIDCTETLSCALWCVIKNLHQPSKILSRVITYGGDTDTISSITGQISGILFCKDAINLSWLETLENKDMLTDLISKLIMKYTCVV
jgi:ADP-ribosylglycohydrolase